MTCAHCHHLGKGFAKMRGYGKQESDAHGTVTEDMIAISAVHGRAVGRVEEYVPALVVTATNEPANWVQIKCEHAYPVNYCPWCGESLGRLMRKGSKEDELS